MRAVESAAVEPARLLPAKDYNIAPDLRRFSAKRCLSHSPGYMNCTQLFAIVDHDDMAMALSLEVRPEEA